MDKVLRCVFVTLFILQFLCVGNLIAQEKGNEDEDAITDELIQKLKGLAEEYRGLKFKEEVKVKRMTMEEHKKRTIEKVEEEMEPGEWEKDEAILKFLRLIKQDVKWKEFLLDFYTKQVAGFYDPETKELYLIDRPEDESPEVKMQEKMLGIKMKHVYLLHELVHALDDQNLNLYREPKDHKTNSDFYAGYKAIIEGEATLIMYAYMFHKNEAMDFQEFQIKQLVQQSKLAQKMDLRFSGVPEFLMEGLTMPYVEGLLLTYKILKEKGWEEFNKLYDNPPLSSEHVYHPEKYLDNDFPKMVKLPDLKDVLGSNWELLDEDAGGEFSAKFVLKAILKKDSLCKKASAGWDGDRSLFFKNKNGDICMVWYTVWDTNNDAQEFFDAYVELLKKKYNQTEVEQSEKDNVKTSALYHEGKSSFVLLPSETDVLVVENLDEETANKVIDIVLKKVSKSELKKIDLVKPEKKRKPKAKETVLQFNAPNTTLSFKSSDDVFTIKQISITEWKINVKDRPYNVRLIYEFTNEFPKHSEFYDEVKVTVKENVKNFQLERETSSDQPFKSKSFVATYWDGSRSIGVTCMRTQKAYFVLIFTCDKNSFDDASKLMQKFIKGLKEEKK